MAEGRDIIVIGGSAGAIEAIRALLKGVDPEIAAALFIVVHSGQDTPRYLAQIFARSTSLQVRYAEDDEPIELGHVYIAPPDRHLLLKPGVCRVVRGPKENNFRPAIDPLFRSAAYTYGSRTIGVLLSGLLDDGVHGVHQIHQQGGITIAQLPQDAQQPDMPLAAIERVGVDHVAPAKEIGPLLNELSQVDGYQSTGPRGEQADVVEGMVSALQLPGLQTPSSPFICPDCGGALWEVQEGALIRYRCHAGHGLTADTLFSSQRAELEQALWTSVRLLEEQAELQRRMAAQWQSSGKQWMSNRFQDNAEDREAAADLIRRLLTGQVRQKGPRDSQIMLREYGA